MKLHTHIHHDYSPALKKLGYTGFALSFRHSFHPSFLPSFCPVIINFCTIFLKNCKDYKVKTWYTHTQWVDVTCIPEEGVTCLVFSSLGLCPRRVYVVTQALASASVGIGVCIRVSTMFKFSKVSIVFQLFKF